MFSRKAQGVRFELEAAVTNDYGLDTSGYRQVRWEQLYTLSQNYEYYLASTIP